MQNILFGKTERIEREFWDENGNLVDPSYAAVSIYDPNGAFFDSGAASQKSTGIYYYEIDLSTASTTKEGIYQAYWEGVVDGVLVTMDEPQYFNGYRVPWQVTQEDEIINSIRRITGDRDPENYKISTRDMYWFLNDAVNDVQSEYDFGYNLTITSTALSWNKDLTTAPFALFKLRALILVMESTLHDYLYSAGNVDIGDIKINVTNIIKLRESNLKRLTEEYNRLMYEIKMNNNTGAVIDTYETGVLDNMYDAVRIVYE